MSTPVSYINNKNIIKKSINEIEFFHQDVTGSSAFTFSFSESEFNTLKVFACNAMIASSSSFSMTFQNISDIQVQMFTWSMTPTLNAKFDAFLLDGGSTKVQSFKNHSAIIFAIVDIR